MHFAHLIRTFAQLFMHFAHLKRTLAQTISILHIL